MWSVGARIATQLVALGVTLIAARFLGPADFGLFAIAAAAVTFIRTLMYSGAYEFLLKSPEPKLWSSEGLAANMLLATALTAIAIACAAAIPGGGRITDLIVALAPSNALAALAAWLEVHLLRRNRLNAYYGVMFVAEGVAGAAAAWALLEGFGIWALVIQAYVRAFMNCALYALMRPAFFSTAFSGARLKGLFGWSLPRYGEVTLAFASQYGSDILLGAFLSPAATGIYRGANRICSAASDVLSQPLRTFGLVGLSRRRAAGQDVGVLVPPLLRLVGLTSWAALAIFAALAGVVVPALLGEAWREAGAIAPILCAALALLTFNAMLVAALVAVDLQKRTLVIRLVTTAALLALSAAAAPFGPGMVAAAMLAGAVLAAAFYLRAVVRRFPAVARPVASVCGLNLATVLATGGSAALALSLMPSPEWSDLARIVVAGACGLAVWLAIAALEARRLWRAFAAGG